MMFRPRTWLLLALTLPLAGCFGSGADKGDNGGSPRPSTVQDANTAGERKTPLPIPEKSDAKGAEGAEPGAK